MVCGHNLPTVVSNYSQTQNNQAMQTMISNATVITVFFFKTWVTETLQANKGTPVLYTYTGWHNFLAEFSIDTKVAAYRKGKIILCFLTVADIWKLQHAISQNGWSWMDYKKVVKLESKKMISDSLVFRGHPAWWGAYIWARLEHCPQ